MDRGDWWATVHGVTESDTTEGLMLRANLAPAPVLLPTCRPPTQPIPQD